MYFLTEVELEAQLLKIQKMVEKGLMPPEDASKSRIAWSSPQPPTPQPTAPPLTTDASSIELFFKRDD